jgi:hypothetical protein
MKPNKIINSIFYISSILLAGSAVAYFFEQTITPYIYTIAAACLSVVFLITLYKGDNFRLKRLNIQQVITALSLAASSYFMCTGKNEWYLFLLIASVLILYGVFVKDHELKKNGKDNESSK